MQSETLVDAAEAPFPVQARGPRPPALPPVLQGFPPSLGSFLALGHCG